MDASSRERGSAGERIAVRYLEGKGYRILETNFTVRFSGGPVQGEVDIIAQKDGTVSFIEVKTVIRKKTEGYWHPEEKVNRQKQRKIMRGAEVWLDKHGLSEAAGIRMDVISISIDSEQEKARIRHIRNAF